MKKKAISTLLAAMLAFSITACGGNSETTETSEGSTAEVTETVVAEVVADEEVDNTEVQQAIDAALAEEQAETEQAAKIVKTVKGDFNGFYDDDSVEVIVDGVPTEFTIGNEEVKTELSNKEEGAAIIFEAEEGTDVIVDIVDPDAVVEPEAVEVTEEETAAGVVVGQLMRYETDTTMVVKVGEEEIIYNLSEAAQKDIYDVKVNFGYDVKFQTEGSGETLTITNFIYE